MVNTKDFFRQNLHQNRVHFPAERNAFVFYLQHDRRDVTSKPAIKTTSFPGSSLLLPQREDPGNEFAIKTGRFLFHYDRLTSQKPLVFILRVSAQILNKQGLAGGVICFISLIASLIFISTDIIATEDRFTILNDVNQYPGYLSGLSRTFFALSTFPQTAV